MSPRKMTDGSLEDLLFAQRLAGREAAYQGGYAHDPLIPIVLALARLDAQQVARALANGTCPMATGDGPGA